MVRVPPKAVSGNSAPVFPTPAPTGGGSLNTGDAISLSVADATGTPTPTYQWKKSSTQNGTYSPVTGFTGATTNTLSKASAATGDTGWYKLTATNSEGSADSDAVQITVTAPTPVLKTIKISGADVTPGTPPVIANATLQEGGTGNATVTVGVDTDAGASLPTGNATSNYSVTGADAGKFNFAFTGTGNTRSLKVELATGTTAGDYTGLNIKVGSAALLPIKVTVAAAP